MEGLETYLDQGSVRAKDIPLSKELDSIRQDNFKKFKTYSIPNRKIEDWKYTNLKSILEQDYKFEKQNSNFTSQFYSHGCPKTMLKFTIAHQSEEKHFS